MAVFSGMLGVTLFGVLVTPVFFYLIDTLSESSWFGSPRVRRIGYRDPGDRDALVPLAALALAAARALPATASSGRA